MCSVSMIGDDYMKTFPIKHPQLTPGQANWVGNSPTRTEFEALKKEVEELKLLLMAAKRFDAQTGQPNCEVDEKVDFIKKLAKLLDVDMSEVFE